MCEDCGALYLNFCLHCAKRGLEERVWEIMDRYNLREDVLIRVLADHIKEGSFPALSLAIGMREMKPSAKSEVSVTDGGEMKEARDRIGVLLNKLVNGKRKPAKE